MCLPWLGDLVGRYFPARRLSFSTVDRASLSQPERPGMLFFDGADGDAQTLGDFLVRK